MTEEMNKVKDYLNHIKANGTTHVVLKTQDNFAIVLTIDGFIDAIEKHPFMMEVRNGIHIKRFSLNGRSIQAKKEIVIPLVKRAARIFKVAETSEKIGWEMFETLVAMHLNGIRTGGNAEHKWDIECPNGWRIESKARQGWIDGTPKMER